MRRGEANEWIGILPSQERYQTAGYLFCRRYEPRDTLIMYIEMKACVEGWQNCAGSLTHARIDFLFIIYYSISY